jgi:hypothetical protein
MLDDARFERAIGRLRPLPEDHLWVELILPARHAVGGEERTGERR